MGYPVARWAFLGGEELQVQMLPLKLFYEKMHFLFSHLPAPPKEKNIYFHRPTGHLVPNYGFMRLIIGVYFCISLHCFQDLQLSNYAHSFRIKM